MAHKEPQANLEAMALALEDQPAVDLTSGQTLPTDGSNPSAAPSGNPGEPTVEGAQAGESAGTPAATAEPVQGTVEPTEPVPTDDELVLTDVEAEAAEKLGNFLEQAREEARREVQGQFDKRFNQYKDQTSAQMKELQDKVREAQLNGLDEATAERLKQTWAYEDKQKELDDYAATLDEQYKDIMVLTLVKEYGDYGVTEEKLAGFDDPDEMENYCKDQAIEFLRSGKTIAPKASAAAPAPPRKPAPAGAKAPVDTGGNPPVPEPLKPDTGFGPDAMLNNFNQLKVERVKVA